METAAGVSAHYRSAAVRVGDFLEVVVEPGVFLRGGHTDQARSLVNPADLDPWDYRQSYGLDTLDLAGYVDVDLRLWKRLRLAGGVRADFLAVSITDNLAGVVPPVATGALPGSLTDVAGVAPGPRLTVAYDIVPELSVVASAGEGFRSLDAGSLTLCNAPALPLSGAPGSQAPPCKPGSPYSQVLSFEGGFRSEAARGRFTTTLAAFQTQVANELVFEVAAGGLTTEAASVRRGVVASFLARPTPWLLASTALSVQRATFDTLVAGGSHYVPNVPAVLWRADVNAHGELVRIKDAPLTGRAGVGYTLLAGRHVNDTHRRSAEQRVECARGGRATGSWRWGSTCTTCSASSTRTTRSTTCRTGATGLGSSRLRVRCTSWRRRRGRCSGRCGFTCESPGGACARTQRGLRRLALLRGIFQSVDLDLTGLPCVVNQLSELRVASYVEAASVMLDRFHTVPPPPTSGRVLHDDEEHEAGVHWREPDDWQRRSHANDHDATEEGAYALAFAAAAALGYVVRYRSLHGSGSDFVVTRIGEPENDYWKLEVSGTAEGDDSEVRARLREKLGQVAGGDLRRPGLAAVVRFSKVVVAIRRV